MSMSIEKNEEAEDGEMGECDRPENIVLPTCSFISPFTAAYLKEMRLVYMTVRPLGQRFSPRGKVLALRMLDRFMHYIIACQYYSTHTEWRRRVGLDEKEIKPTTNNNDSAYTIVLPSFINADSMVESLMTQQAEAIKRYTEAPAEKKEKLSHSSDEGAAGGILVNFSTAERWVNDFLEGAKLDEQAGRFMSKKIDQSFSSSFVATSTNKNDKSAQIAHLQSAESKIALCVIADSFFAELCERSSHDGSEYSSSSRINMCDIYRAIIVDKDFESLVSFLGVDWVIETEIPEILLNLDEHDPIDESCLFSLASNGSDQLMPPFEDLLKSEFAEFQSMMKKENEKTSWYFNKEKLHEYAKRFARGEVKESPITQSLRSLNARPYQRWGGHVTLFAENHRLENSYEKNAASRSDLLYSPHNFQYCSFILEDAKGQQWKFLIEYDRGDGYHGRVIELTKGEIIGDFSRDIIAGEKKVLCMKLKKAAELSSLGQEKYACRTIEELREMIFGATIIAPVSSSSSASSVSSSSSTSPSKAFSPLERISCTDISFTKYASSSTLVDLAAVKENSPQIELQLIVAHVLHLSQIENYGPTLYIANQPIALREEFTIALLDEAMRISSIELMPTDLLKLITEYDCFDLPFIESEAQLQRAAFVNRPWV